MLDKLPILQKFLAFLSNPKNVLALVVFLLFASLYVNYRLSTKIDELYLKVLEERAKSINFERERAKSYEDIIKESFKQPRSYNEKDSVH